MGPVIDRLLVLGDLMDKLISDNAIKFYKTSEKNVIINYKSVLIEGFSYYNVLQQMPVRNPPQDLSAKHTFLEEHCPGSTSNRLELLRQDAASGVSVEPLLVVAWTSNC